MKRTSKQKPKPAMKIKVREISEAERRVRTKQESKEFRQLLDLAAEGKTMHIACDEYREARVLAQRLAACRSFYGHDVRIQHRGKDIYLSARIPGVEVEELPKVETEAEGSDGG